VFYTFFRCDLLSVSYISSSASWGRHWSYARAGDPLEWVASVSPAPLSKSEGELWDWCLSSHKMVAWLTSSLPML